MQIWTDAAEDNLSNEGVENNKEEPIIIIGAERSEMLTPQMTPAKTTKKANIIHGMLICYNYVFRFK